MQEDLNAKDQGTLRTGMEDVLGNFHSLLKNAKSRAIP